MIPPYTLWLTHFKPSYNGIIFKSQIFPGYLYSAENLDFRGFLIRVGSQNNIPNKEDGVGEFISLDSAIQKHVCGKVRNDLGQHLLACIYMLMNIYWHSGLISGEIYIAYPIHLSFY